jgi:hypothetical protein
MSGKGASTSSLIIETLPLLVSGACSAVTDSKGHKLFATCVGTSTLVLVRFDGTFRVETIIDDVTTPTPTLILDAADSPHVFWSNGQGLHESVKRGAAWEHALVVPAPDNVPAAMAVRGGAIAGSDDGTIWIAAPRYEELALYSNRGGAWQRRHAWPVKGRPFFHIREYFVALAARGDALQLAFVDGDVFKWATYDGTAIAEQTICEQGGAWPSLALDADGVPHVSYLTWRNAKSALEYARRVNDRFEIAVVDTKGNAGFGSKLAFHDGKPIIFYGARPSPYSPEEASLDKGVARWAQLDDRWKVDEVGPGWHVALATGGDEPWGLTTASPIQESGSLRVVHTLGSLASARFEGVPTPIRFGITGLKQRLLDGETVRLESKGSDAVRIFEITLSGASHTVVTGAEPGKRKSKEQAFASVDEARADALKQLEKYKNGKYYTERGG